MNTKNRKARLSTSLLAASLLACGGGNTDTQTPETAASQKEPQRSLAVASAGPGGSATIEWLQVPVQPDPLLDNLVPTATAHQQGMWSPLINWPINAIHLLTLPSGKVLSYGTRPYSADNGTGNQDGGANVLWDPAAGTGVPAFTVTQFSSDPKRQINSFCSAGAVTATGRVLTSGGFGGPYSENDSVTGSSSFMSGEYDPATNLTLDSGYRTADERWYATMLTLADGRPVLLGGMLPYAEASWNNPSTSNGLASMTPEVFTPGVGWSTLPGAYSTLAFGQYNTRSEFPHAWVAPNGEVFGISSDQMWFMNPLANNGQGSIRIVGEFKGRARGLNAGETPATLPNVGSSTSSAVMFAPGKAIQMGGNGYWVLHDLPASSAATVVDFNNGQATLQETAPMNFARRFFNASVLPDGQVFVNGGTRLNHSEAQAVYNGEIWNPATGRWQVMAAQQRARLYHNSAALLPNGTVLSAGGGNPGPVFNNNAEVFYPPYLFQRTGNVTALAARPAITGTSTFKVSHQSPFSLLLSTAGPIREVVMMGMSVTTHGFNPAQRRIPLAFTQEGGRIDTAAPDANLTPPGYYMVFVVDQQGVPSKGLIVAVGADVAAPPVPQASLAPVTLASALPTPMVATGQPARWEPRLSLADAQVSWDFGDGSPATAFGPNVATAHTYAAPGLYTVVLRMRSVNGTVSTHSFIQAVTAGTLSTSRSRHSGPMALEARADGNHQLWAVNPDHDNVAVLATRTGVRRLIGVGTDPQALALSSAGVMAIANKGSRNLMLYNAATAARLRTVTLPYGSRPHGVVFSPDGATGYVALEGTGQVARFTTATGALLPAIEVGGVLRHLSISGDGRTLAASRFITPPLPGEGTANVDVSQAGAEVAFIDLGSSVAAPRVAGTLVLKHSNAPDTAISGRGIPNYLGPLVMSPDETRALVPSKQDNILRGALRDGQPLDFQNTVRAVTSRVDLVGRQEMAGGRVDHDNASVASAAAYHPSGLYAFVTLETSRELVVLDVQQGLQLFRVDVGHAPQGVVNAADGRSVYVYNFMSRSVTEVSLADLLDFGQRRAAVLRTLKTTDAVVVREAGQRLFYDARDPRLAADGYMSCASCHNAGGSDGRVWDLSHQGEGLRNTPMLRARVGTTHGNMHWTGNFDEVQDFETQIRNLAGGRGLMSDAQYFSGTVSAPLGQRKTGRSADLDALAAYVNGLTDDEPSPRRQANGAVTTQGAAGRTLFTQKGCTSCHAGAPFTNSRTGARPDIGTLKASSGLRLGEPLTGLDVPSLRGAWATAPYLHDGSALTVEEAIRAHVRPAAVLTAAEIANLATYVREIE